MPRRQGHNAGNLHTGVVTAKKAVTCWGFNGYGAVGDHTTTDTPQPVKVLSF